MNLLKKLVAVRHCLLLHMLMLTLVLSPVWAQRVMNADLHILGYVDIDGDLTIFKNFNFPTTSSDSVGVIEQNGAWFLHSFGNRTNTFLGYGAGNFTLTKGSNTGIGSGVMYGLVDGQQNTSVGVNSMQLNEDGSFNTAVGNLALRGAGGGGIEFDYNVGIGYGAGAGLTTGQSNTFIGTGAGDELTTGDSNIIIGRDQQSTGVGADSQINIGGVYKGVIDREAIINDELKAYGRLTFESEQGGDQLAGAASQALNYYKITLDSESEYHAGDVRFTGTNGHLFKVYDEDNTVVHDGGEHTVVYANMKLLSPMTNGGKSVLFSGHNYGSGGDYQIIDAADWRYGNFVDGYKISGGSIVTGIDLSETTVTSEELLGSNGENWENISTDGFWTTDGGIVAVGGLGSGDITISDATPILQYKDTDASAGDVNVSIQADATDTGDGTEDIDVLFNAQVAGTAVGFMSFDADGDFFLRSGGGANTQLVLDSGGSVGIGTATPTVKLDVTGSILASVNVAGATYGSDGTVTDAELLYINSLSSNAQTQFGAKADTALVFHLAQDETVTGQTTFSDTTNHLVIISSGNARVGGSVYATSGFSSSDAFGGATLSSGGIGITGEVGNISMAPSGILQLDGSYGITLASGSKLFLTADGVGVNRENADSTLDVTGSGHFSTNLLVGGTLDVTGAITGSNLSGSNTGDEDLSGLLLKSAIPDTMANYISDVAYDATSWDANTDAPTKNAVRDKFETLAGGHDAVSLSAFGDEFLSLSTQEITLQLTDPDADRLMLWDDDPGDFVWIDPATYLTNLDSLGIVALGFVAGAHTVDTTLDSLGIDALGFNAGGIIPADSTGTVLQTKAENDALYTNFTTGDEIDQVWTSDSTDYLMKGQFNDSLAAGWILEAQITDLAHFTTGDELDPQWVADSSAIISAIELNTAKETNVVTNIVIVEAPTNVEVQSSDGTNDTIAAADETNAGVMTTAMYDNYVLNTAKVGVTTQISNVVEDTSPELGADLDVTDFEILLDSTPDTDLTASGTKAVFTNGNAGNTKPGDLCYIAADGDVEFADATDASEMPGMVMALAETAPTASGEFLLQGFIRNDDWTWTPGGLIYATITGTTENTLSQTAPIAGGEVVQVVGIATHADRIYFNPSYVLVVI